MKVKFINEPRLAVVGNDDVWRLTEPFQVDIEEDDGHIERIVVPAGMETDLASVPRLPWAYLLFANRGRRSAILHDYLYETHRPRAWADAVFREAMRNEGVGAISRFFMWLGVRIGGGSHYEAATASASETISRGEL